MSVAAGGAETPSTGTYSNVSGTNWTVELMPSALPETKLAKGEIGTYDADLVAVGVFADAFETQRDNDTESVTCTSESLMSKDGVLNGALSHIMSQGDFKGESGKRAVVRGAGGVKNIGLFGLGKRTEAALKPKWGRSVYYKFGAQIGHAAKGHKCGSIAIALDSLPEEDLSEVMAQLISGLLLDCYEATRYKEKAKKNPLKTIALMNLDGVEAGVKKGYAIAKGTLLTIYLVESPPNVCYPQHIADAAGMIAKKFPTFTLKANPSA